MEERYVAFDVETPNAQNRRMSAIGVSVIERGEIVQELYTLVDPQTHFDPFNIALTGITPEMERGQPTFPVLWELLEPILRGSVLVAHNAPFDLRVLAAGNGRIAFSRSIGGERVVVCVNHSIGEWVLPAGRVRFAESAAPSPTGEVVLMRGGFCLLEPSTPEAHISIE